MRILGTPPEGDTSIISGESGATVFGCVAEIMTDPRLSLIREALGLDISSRVLFFGTEGATNLKNYRKNVWNRDVSGRRQT